MCGGYLDLEPTTDCPALQPFSGGSRNFEGGGGRGPPAPPP